MCRLTTLVDVPKSLEHLAYLGYMYEHDNQLSALHGKHAPLTTTVFFKFSLVPVNICLVQFSVV